MSEAKRVPVTSYFSAGGLAAIDELAASEDRSRSVMVRVLVAEAVAARRKKHGTNPA